MNNAELSFRHFMFKALYHPHDTKGFRDDFMGREIIVTPFNGNYGIAGYVMAIEGSPPRGVVVAIRASCGYNIFLMIDEKSRHIGTARSRVVTNYLKEIGIKLIC